MQKMSLTGDDLIIFAFRAANVSESESVVMSYYILLRSEILISIIEIVSIFLAQSYVVVFSRLCRAYVRAISRNENMNNNRILQATS